MSTVRWHILNKLQKYIGKTIFVDEQPIILNKVEWLSKYVLKINERVIYVDTCEFESGNIYLYELDMSQDNYFDEGIQNEIMISFNRIL